jgi:hypothetical protein
MSIVHFGIQFRCDLCGVTANLPSPEPGPIQYGQIPLPPGWSALAPDWNIQLLDIFGSAVSHLCPVCSGLSIGELVARLRAQAKART